MEFKAIIIVLLCCQQLNGLTFFLTEGKERCFYDDYAINTVVIGSHQLIDKLAKNQLKEGVNLRVLDPDNQVIITKFTNNEEGKFTFTTKKGGKHQVCLKTTTAKWFGEKAKPKYMLRLKQGDDFEFTSAAKESQVSNLKQRILQLQNAEKDFIKLQEMNRENEDKLSQENLKINDRVLKATIFQTIVILLAGVFQIYSLRKFFQKKLYY